MKPGWSGLRSGRRQRGIAAILLVILVGLALVVTVGGVFSVARSAQERTVAVHAATPAQASAWQAAEVIRRYLDVVEPQTIRAWWTSASRPTAAAPMALALGGMDNIQAQVTDITKVIDPPVPTDPLDNDFVVTVELVGNAGVGPVAATAPLELVYTMTLRNVPPAPSGEVEPLNFYRDLHITGDTEFSGAANAEINVTGDVTITATNLTGVSEINTTGNVYVDSAVKLARVQSNGDVQIVQGADSAEILARGSVLISGGGHHGTVQANGPVSMRWATVQTSLKTPDTLTVGHPTCSCGTVCPGETKAYDGSYIESAEVGGAIDWYSCGGGFTSLLGNSTLRYHGAATKVDTSYNESSIRHLQHGRTHGDIALWSQNNIGRFTSRGNIVHDSVTVNANGVHENYVEILGYCALKDLTFAALNWMNVSKIVGWFGGVFTHPPLPSWKEKYTSIQPLGTAPAGTCDFDLPTVTVPEVPVYTHAEPPKVNVRALQGAANMVFERTADGETQVTMRSMNGVLDGSYVLGYKQPDVWSPRRPDHLCSPDHLTGGRDPATGQRKCATPLARLCQADANESCFVYDQATETWSIGSDTWNVRSIARGVAWFEGNLRLGPVAYVNSWLATGNVETHTNHTTWAPNAAGYDKLCANADIPWDGSLESTPGLAGLYPTNLCNTTAMGVVYSQVGNVAVIAGSYDADGNFVGGNIRINSPDGKTKLIGSLMAGNEVISRGFAEVQGHILAAAQGQPSGPSQPSGDLKESFRLTLDDISGFVPPDMPDMGNNNARMPWARYR